MFLYGNLNSQARLQGLIVPVWEQLANRPRVGQKIY
jgi:hypothetical protein